MTKKAPTMMEIAGRLTVDVRHILGSGSVSPKAFVNTFTEIQNFMLDLRLLRNKKAAVSVADSTVKYKRLRYESDEIAGPQEAARLIKGETAESEKQIEDLQSFIKHLKGLLDLMSMFEKMTRY